jgi:hypothetical protein
MAQTSAMMPPVEALLFIPQLTTICIAKYLQLRAMRAGGNIGETQQGLVYVAT